MKSDFLEFQWRIMKRLLNEEYFHRYVRLVEFFDGKGFEDPYIVEAISKARLLKDDVNDVAKTSLFHKNTKELGELSLRCRDLTRGLFKSIEAGSLGVTSEEVEAAEDLFLWVRKSRKGAMSHNREKQWSAIGNLEKSLLGNPAAAAALEKLSLTARFEAIVTTYKDAIDMEQERDRDIANIKKRTREVRQASYFAIDTLLSAVAGRVYMGGDDSELCYSIYKEVDHFLTMIRARVESRDTRNANAADKADDQNAESNQPEADHNPETGSDEGIDQGDSGDNFDDTPELDDSDDDE